MQARCKLSAGHEWIDADLSFSKQLPDGRFLCWQSLPADPSVSLKPEGLTCLFADECDTGMQCDLPYVNDGQASRKCRKLCDLSAATSTLSVRPSLPKRLWYLLGRRALPSAVIACCGRFSTSWFLRWQSDAENCSRPVGHIRKDRHRRAGSRTIRRTIRCFRRVVLFELRDEEGLTSVERRICELPSEDVHMPHLWRCARPIEACFRWCASSRAVFARRPGRRWAVFRR